MTLTAKGLQYANDAVGGKIEVCLYVKLACRRHLEDLKKSRRKDYPYRFDGAKSERVLRFIELMPHVKGKWAGTLTKLEPFQCFMVGVSFGWVRKKDGLRRFRERYIELPRKNGKTHIEAAIGLYMLTMDGEAGAEVYCGASKEKQAWEVFGPARQMVLTSPDFRKHMAIHVGARALTILNTMSKFEPLIGDPADGGSPSYAIADECHQHKTNALRNTMVTGMGARSQPMMSEITTAGTNLSYPCYERSLYVKQVLEGFIEDDELFGLIYTIDKDDDWTDFNVWIKANPNYGVSITEDYLKAQYREALRVPAQANINKCKHLNIWSGAAEGWLNMAKWRHNKTPLPMTAFKGERCWVAADFASKIDLTAVMFLFRREEKYYLFGRYYLPEETVALDKNYKRWRDKGELIATPGARTDFNTVEADLRELSESYQIERMAFDPREATKLMSDIAEWAAFDLIEITQTPIYISEPMKDFEALVEDGRLLTSEADTLIDWTAGNVVKKSTKTKAYYPAKESAVNKIDPIVAGIMAVKLGVSDQNYDPFVAVI
jgi:phage terminase large subunit-like protein